MGNFYANLTVHGASPEAIAGHLERTGKHAFVSPLVGRDVVVFVDAYGDDELAAIAGPLAAELDCDILTALNHDDDILMLGLFRGGSRVGDYNSTPGYFETGGDDPPSGALATTLCATFGVPEKVAAVEEILVKPRRKEGGYLFAIDRHADLAEALGIPDAVAGGGHEYIVRGEEPPGLEIDELTETCAKDRPEEDEFGFEAIDEPG